MRTLAVLPDRAVLPKDIPHLVAAVYDNFEAESSPIEMLDDFIIAKEAWSSKIDILNGRAKAFQVSQPRHRSSLLGWLDTSASDSQGDAAVRDGSDSLEVIVIQRRGSELYFLSCIENAEALPIATPNDELARRVLGCSLRLPAMFGEEWMIDRAIKELEEIMTAEGLTKGWYLSHWLKGMLVMVLDENLETILCGHRLRYSKELGLVISALS